MARFAPDAGAVAGFAAFLGHIFPVWLKFKGGKGVATFVGCLLGFAWPAGLAFIGVWLAVAYLSRYSSLSALVASALSPVVLWFLGLPAHAALVAVMAAILWAKHGENIARLRAGTEGKIGQEEMKARRLGERRKARLAAAHPLRQHRAAHLPRPDPALWRRRARRLRALPDLIRQGKGRAVKLASREQVLRELGAGAKVLRAASSLCREPDYPPGLRAIDAPPPLIAVRGDATLLLQADGRAGRLAQCFGRRPRHDRKAGARICGAAGYVVVSGLARGIDAARASGVAGDRHRRRAGGRARPALSAGKSRLARGNRRARRGDFGNALWL